MDSLKAISDEVRACRKCGLWKARTNAVPGEGPAHAKIMLIGQAPGKEEDASGRPFVGKAGKFLDSVLEKSGLEKDKLFITSPVKCYPPRNRKPHARELKACRGFLDRQFAIIKPKIIVLMGDTAFHSFFPGESLKKQRGRWLVKDQRLFLPTYHPSAAMRFPGIKKALMDDFRKLALYKK
jgi:uracil-DNA glycosylase family 4